MKKTNKMMIGAKVNELGYTLGCYTDMIDKLSKKDIERIIEKLNFGDGDLKVSLKKVDYIVEVHTVDDEKDVLLNSRAEYHGDFDEVE